jgi:hypothetical protein
VVSVQHGVGSHRGPVRLRIATGLAVAAAAALLVAIIRTAAPGPAGPGPADEVVRVGVVEGQSVPGYLGTSRGELGALLHAPARPGDTWALVSLTAYFALAVLPGVLGGAAVAQVYARAPAGTAQTQVVRIPAHLLPGDVVAGMAVAAAVRERERADYAKLSRELTGGDPNDMRLRRAYADAAGAAGAEAVAYRQICSCVFAAVVRAAPAVLQRIAARAQVRVVDPAPEVRSLQQAEFRPPLPEESTTVPVETRPTGVRAPSGGLILAPETPAALPSSLGAGVTSASSQRPAVGSGFSVPASEEHAAVASAPAAAPVSRCHRPAGEHPGKHPGVRSDGSRSGTVIGTYQERDCE